MPKYGRNPINPINSQIVQAYTIGQRIWKGLRQIKMDCFDVYTGRLCAPYGVDSNPAITEKKLCAVSASTSNYADTVCFGFFNRNPQALPGELRLFSTDADGVEKAFAWLRNTGVIEIMGTEDNLMRFAPSKEGFDALVESHNALVEKYNDLVAKFNTHVHPTTAPGAPTTGPIAPSGPPPTPTPGDVPVSGSPANTTDASIDDAKIDELKTKGVAE